MPNDATIERLVWDEWNRDHITKHAVTPQEVEDVCLDDPVIREGYKGRIIAIGPTRAGRWLAAVIGPVPGEPGAYYTFSARPASRQERRRYREAKGVDQP